MVAVGAVTGLIYLFCHFVSLKLCSDWLFWHYSDHISVYIYIYRLYMLISSISENLFILQIQTSRQYCKVFKVIES